MAKLIAIVPMVLIMTFSPASYAKNDKHIEVFVKKVGDFEINLTPACNTDDFKKVCRMHHVKKTHKLSVMKGYRFNEFVSRNGLNAQLTSRQTIVPAGIYYVMK
jgi:hypothetical protein